MAGQVSNKGISSISPFRSCAISEILTIFLFLFFMQFFSNVVDSLGAPVDGGARRGCQRGMMFKDEFDKKVIYHKSGGWYCRRTGDCDQNIQSNGKYKPLSLTYCLLNETGHNSAGHLGSLGDT